MKRLLSIFALLGLGLLAGCTVENQGPPGPRGPRGPAGPGTDFTVINVTATPNDWLALGNQGDADFQYYVEFNAPEIDQYVFDNAVVMGYLIDQGTAYTLPNTINYGNYTREFSMYYGVGYLGFVVKDSDLQTTPPSSEIRYRVYIMEAGTAKRGQPLSEPELRGLLQDQKGQVVHLQEARPEEVSARPRP
jgi:hypothetical protein